MTKRSILIFFAFLLFIPLVVSLPLLLLSAQKVSAAEVNTIPAAESPSYKRVATIGEKILKDNNLPTKVVFYVSDQEEMNAYANIENEVHVFEGLIKIVETDEELASVIAHEIAHIVNNHVQRQTVLGAAAYVITSKLISAGRNPILSKAAQSVGVLSLMKVSRSAEYEADITGADLMAKAGFNNIAMISLLSKISQNYVDVIQTHPSGNKRLKSIYDYISFNYPDKALQNYNTESFKKFIPLRESIIFERESDPKKMAEYKNRQTKIKNDRAKKAKRIEAGKSNWASAYNAIKLTIPTEE